MWAADSGVMWAAIPLRCGPHFLFHRNRGPHGVIAAHIEWNQRPRCSVTVAHMERNGNSGSGRERTSLVIPGRCFPEIKGERVARKEITHAPVTRSPASQLRITPRPAADRLDLQSK